MSITVAKSSGFCYGVQRAVSLCEEAALEYPGCVTLGPIINNEAVVQELEAKGVRAVKDISGIMPNDTVIIRSHGASESELEKLSELGVRIVDATCPCVKRIHDIVRSEAGEGRLPVIIGERSHPEIDAIASRCARAVVLETPEELAQWLKKDDNAQKFIVMVFQTTNSGSNYDSCADILKKECTNHKIFDTICSATHTRQQEAAELSKRSDVMIVVGSHTSANSLRLADICGQYCSKVIFTENAADLELADIHASDTVGIIAGASTPAWIIKEVTQKMSEEIKHGETCEEQVHDELEDTSPTVVQDHETDAADTADTETGKTETEGEEPGSSTELESAPEDEAAGEPEASDSQETADEPAAAEVKEEADAAGVADTADTAVIEAPSDEPVAADVPESEDTQETADEPAATDVPETADSQEPAEEPVAAGIPEAADTQEPTLTSEDQIDPADVEDHPEPDKDAAAAKPSDAYTETGEETGDETDDSSSSSESFEEMLEKSIKTLHTGQKVTGIVTSITSTEVSVDLGTKQSGYIPISEFADDSNSPIEDIIKIGDSIETFVMRVNDVEGMVMLSKKRLDAIKNWDVIEAAKESRDILEGLVTEENKGGIVVNVKGVRVFIPASQTGLPKTTPMTELIKKTVKLRITEVNQSRRRVVGSIRAVQADERREKSERLWNEIEAGKQYNGVVKSMTSYGVFVDIGGVDGMIHISELSWTRIKLPSEVMSVGDEVSVYVLSFDKETRKISLGYKKNEDNPWTKFTTNNAVGDIVNVKIVKLMPFGAFAEINPGVDGLIHISQITDHRIGLPSEVLTDGQMVDVKITEIDNDRKKVSLSIRALIDPSSQKITDAEAEQAAREDNTPVIVYDTDAPPPPDPEDPEDQEPFNEPDDEPADQSENAAADSTETAGEPEESPAENPVENPAESPEADDSADAAPTEAASAEDTQEAQ